ncbi:MAG: phenylalanine--tRNA ligase subunit beta [Patescibacteria group bacterium]|jgi:phenylalanyl-tRNA synthetase beta chain
MNLNISYNWLKSYVKTSLTPQEFAKRISLSGPSVDRINAIKPNFSKVVVGQIKKIEQHPNADKLHVCKVNIGKEELQIVCGAPNIKEGQKVPVVLVGGQVGEFEIKEAKLRGVESFGMMCSQKELGLGEDHTGIYILPADAKVGEPLEKIMPMDDAILDIEITSNRPDAMSVIGIAREASAILDAKFLYQAPKPNLAVKGGKKDLKIKVAEEKFCPRYSAIVMGEVKVEASPLWMQQRLLASGLRPINNLVDITNYILLEYGQPMHVFDYDKLSGAEINVRKAKKGEKILALDGKEYELLTDQLVIADAKVPVAVAGVMGGELSAATTETKTIVFECANFNPVSVRKTSRALNLRSESSALYEKGISPENVIASMLRAIELAQELCGAKIAGRLIDEKSYKIKDKEIVLDLDSVNSALGVKIKPAEIKKNLEALGFKVSSTKSKRDEFMVVVPWWRENDIDGQHDLIEEIARMHGYYNLPTELMSGALPKAASSINFGLEDKIKDVLVGFGLTEVYTYSFISEKQITACGLKPEDHIKIANPLSVDFEYMRISLLPGVLQIIAENEGFYPAGKLFDFSQVYLPLGANDLADEKFKLLIACYGAEINKVAGDVRGLLDGLMQRLYISGLVFKNTADGSEIYVGDNKLGEIKVINNKILSAFGIKKAVTIVELDFEAVSKSAKSAPTYQPIPKFPAIELDLSMEIDNVVTFAEVANIATDAGLPAGQAGAPLVERVDFLSVYRGNDLPEGKKALAIRIVYRDLNKTLELAEAQKAHDKVVAELKKSYNISVR